MNTTTYSDKFGTFFGRRNEDGTVSILHIEDGMAATRLDAKVYPIGSALGARHEHPDGITLSQADCEALGIAIE